MQLLLASVLGIGIREKYSEERVANCMGRLRAELASGISGVMRYSGERRPCSSEPGAWAGTWFEISLVLC